MFGYASFGGGGYMRGRTVRERSFGYGIYPPPMGGVVSYGYGYGPMVPRPMGYFSGWAGFHSHWAGYMGWMDHCDYTIWHQWQQMLGGGHFCVADQRSMLLGMLQQGHNGMAKGELEALTDRMLDMNKQLGAGDDGRVQEITETTTTTTTSSTAKTTASDVTVAQRYETANDFLQQLTASGSMGCTLEQAQQKATEIREGQRDELVKMHLANKASKPATTSTTATTATTTTSTTSTNTASDATVDQRYETANDFLELLTTSGGMGCSLEQARQKATEIREGKRDDFVKAHLASKAAQKLQPPQPAIEAPPQQKQVEGPPPTPSQAVAYPYSSSQPQSPPQLSYPQQSTQQPIQSYPVQVAQPTYAPPAQVQAHNFNYPYHQPPSTQQCAAPFQHPPQTPMTHQMPQQQPHLAYHHQPQTPAPQHLATPQQQSQLAHSGYYTQQPPTPQAQSSPHALYQCQSHGPYQHQPQPPQQAMTPMPQQQMQQAPSYYPQQ